MNLLVSCSLLGFAYAHMVQTSVSRSPYLLLALTVGGFIQAILTAVSFLEWFRQRKESIGA